MLGILRSTLERLFLDSSNATPSCVWDGPESFFSALGKMERLKYYCSTLAASKISGAQHLAWPASSINTLKMVALYGPDLSRLTPDLFTSIHSVLVAFPVGGSNIGIPQFRFSGGKEILWVVTGYPTWTATNPEFLRAVNGGLRQMDGGEEPLRMGVVVNHLARNARRDGITSQLEKFWFVPAAVDGSIWFEERMTWDEYCVLGATSCS